MPPTKATNVSLTISQRQELRDYHSKHKCTQNQLATWAKKQFHLVKEPTQPTILNILKETPKTAHPYSNNKRLRSPRYPRLEEVLEIWMARCEDKNYPITWDMVKRKAEHFAIPLQITDFSYSNGWIEGFRRPSGFRAHRLHGEATSSDSVAASIHLDDIQQKIGQFALKDVYNMDETALFYRSAPQTTISREQASGTKADKTRITLALTVNADGSDRREALIIGKSSNLRCFGRGKTAASHGFSQYFGNANAWMTKAIFKDYIIRFDRAMQYQKRHVLLILDNFTGHKIQEMYSPSNIEFLFLPPNTTTLLQPLDAGIIKNFKTHYRNLQMDQAYRRMSTGMPAKELYKIDQLQAMKWCQQAWRNVSEVTIKNCFNKTGILHARMEVDPSAADQYQQSLENEMRSNIAAIYGEANPVDYEVETTEEASATHYHLSDEEIVRTVLEPVDNAEENVEEQDEVSEAVHYSWEEKLNTYNKVLDFLEIDDGDDATKNGIRKLRDQARLGCRNSLQQSSITSYFRSQ